MFGYAIGLDYRPNVPLFCAGLFF